MQKAQRIQKEQVVRDIREKIEMAKGLFIFEYHGLNVEDMTTLRQKIRGGKGELKVLKNTLVKRALGGMEIEPLVKEELAGPLACAFSYGDVVPIAKTLIEFEKDEKSLPLKVAILGYKKFSLNEIKQLAKLPPKDVLMAKFIGTLAAPLNGLIYALAAVPGNFINVIRAIEKKKKNA